MFPVETMVVWGKLQRKRFTNSSAITIPFGCNFTRLDAFAFFLWSTTLLSFSESPTNPLYPLKRSTINSLDFSVWAGYSVHEMCPHRVKNWLLIWYTLVTIWLEKCRKRRTIFSVSSVPSSPLPLHPIHHNILLESDSILASAVLLWLDHISLWVPFDWE